MAAPALFWWHLELKLSKKDGVKRAHAALANTATGQITKNEDSATLVSKDFIATISCVPRGRKKSRSLSSWPGRTGMKRAGQWNSSATACAPGYSNRSWCAA